MDTPDPPSSVLANQTDNGLAAIRLAHAFAMRLVQPQAKMVSVPALLDRVNGTLARVRTLDPTPTVLAAPMVTGVGTLLAASAGAMRSAEVLGTMV